MPHIAGISETALYVADIEWSAKFYEDVLGFRRVAGDDRFCGLRVASGQVLLLFQKGGTLHPVATRGGMIPPHDGAGQLHLAFAIALTEFADWERHLRDKGIPIESTVNWPGGQRSLYFRDLDQHLVELATPGLWMAG